MMSVLKPGLLHNVICLQKGFAQSSLHHSGSFRYLTYIKTSMLEPCHNVLRNLSCSYIVAITVALQ